MTSELWAVARFAQVQHAIAECRANPAARDAIAPDFPATYTGVAAGRPPGYWNGYLTWVLVQRLAIIRYADLPYSIREAAILLGRFLDEPAPQPARRGPRALLPARSHPLRESVPEIAAILGLLATLGGAAAEGRIAALAPDSDLSWSEEGTLFFSDAERDRIARTLSDLRAMLLGPEHGERFHFWIVRQPNLPRAVREALRLPDRFLSDLEAIFTDAQRTDAEVFVLWAP